MNITAGSDVAFATALMRCTGRKASGEREELEFRLTIGLRKIGGEWIVVHEHHSIPGRLSSREIGNRVVLNAFHRSLYY
jgi:ketosteroid isomerase-like protein